MVGELTANAAYHQTGDAGAEIRISATDGGGLLVEVLDTDVSIPSVVVVEPWTTDGHRGLFLVEAISEGWGAEHVPAGKRVWARLAPAGDRSGVSPVEHRSVERSAVHGIERLLHLLGPIGGRHQFVEL